MTDVRSRLADALREHRLKCITCSYGQESDRHWIDVLLSLPGIAIVDTNADIELIAKAMFDNTHGFPEWDVIIDDDRELYRALAREALLAAANTAEADQ